MEMNVEPFGYLVQTTSDKNPPHGWAVHMFAGKGIEGSIPFYLAEPVEYLRKECERAWKEVDFIAKERTEHLEWRTKLANDLDECEMMRDALGKTLNKRENDLMEALNALGKIITMANRAIGLPASKQDDYLSAISDLARKVALSDSADRRAEGGEMTLLERFDTHYGTSACVCAYSDSHEELRRAIAIAQAVDEWRPSPPHDDDLRQRSEADAKLRLLFRAEELLRATSSQPDP